MIAEEPQTERGVWPYRPHPLQFDVMRYLGLTPGDPPPEGVPCDLVLMAGEAQGGKALGITTGLPTPTGWTTMGDVHVGDRLLDEQGRPCTILRVSGVLADRPCYEVTFDDGSTLIADADHQWVTRTYHERATALKHNDAWRARRRETRPAITATGGRRGLTGTVKKPEGLPQVTTPPATGQIRTTREIAETLLASRVKPSTNHSIDNTRPLCLPDQTLPIDPYCFGIWLGDGTSTQGAITTADPEEVLPAFAEAGYTVTKRQAPYAYGILGLQEQLRELGVLNNKHIPTIYLRASEAQRWALLDGLMDTDGYVSASGKCAFYTTSPAIAGGFYELLVTLGMKCHQREKRAMLQGKDCGPCYVFHFTPPRPVVRLSRKAERQRTVKANSETTRRLIVAVTPVPSVSVQCVEVDSPSHCYLAGESMIPTHNSMTARILAVTIALTHPGSTVAIFRRVTGDLAKTQIDPLRKEVPPELGEFNQTEKTFYWNNGSQTRFHHCVEEHDEEKYRSHLWDALVLEESTEFTWDQVTFLTSRVVGGKWPGWHPIILLTTNSIGVSHLPHKLFFIAGHHGWDTWTEELSAEAEAAKARPKRIGWIPITTKDNPSVDLAMTKASQYSIADEEMRRSMAEGSWDLNAGQFFSGFRKSVNVVPHYEPAPDWTVWRGLDYGEAAPACCLWAARDPRKSYPNVYIFQEFYRAAIPPQLQAKIILQLSEGHPSCHLTYADPSIWKQGRKGITGPSLEAEYKAGGLHLSKANNKREEGWARIQRGFFRGITTAALEPEITISENCVELIRFLETAQRSEANYLDIKQPSNASGWRDDAGDACRYLLAGSAPKPARSRVQAVRYAGRR